MTTATLQQTQPAGSTPTPRGWMVLGLNTHSISPQALKVPVIATNAQAAMLKAASETPGFEPVGAMSAEELQADMDKIRAHCQANGVAV